MGWIKREVDEHNCHKPSWNKTVHEGDVWQCDDCSEKWVVDRIIPAGHGGYLDNWYHESIMWKQARYSD